MGFKFRKSVKIAPGVRVNFGKKSSSISFGGKGARYTVSSSGRRTTSVGIPGTGLSYTSTSSKRRKAPEAKAGHGFWWWVLVGWWWWPCRAIFYDFPRLIIKAVTRLVKNLINAIKPAQNKSNT